MPVSFLTEAERERLSRFPAQVLPEDLITFFTLSDSDKVEVLKQRGDHNRLGFALQLCILRYLGFSPDDLDSVPYAVVDFVARQLKVPPEAITPYGRRIPTRTAHLQQVQAYLAFRKATPLDWEILAAWLLERALEHDKPMLLLQLACEKLLRDRIVRPGISRLERMVATARQDAQKETFRRLASLLEQERHTFLDQLLIPDQMGRTPLTWLREGAKSNSAEEILNAVKKLDFLREAGVEGWDMTTLNPNRLKFLAQIGRKATNQYLQRANEERRYPILLALLKQSLVDVTDETIEMYDQCLWECYSDARKDLEELRKSQRLSTNEMLCLLRDIGQVILDPEVSDPNVRSAIFYRTPREKLQKAVEETGRMIRPADDSHFDFFARRYNYIRRFSPAFLGSITFHANTPYNSLLEAVDLLRDLDKKGPRRRVPDDAPLEFITEKKWRPYLFDREGRLSRRYYELCVLWELRSALRAGNVWVENSRRYADLETYLIPPEQWSKLRPEVCRQVRAPQDGAKRLREREEELKGLLDRVNKLLSDKEGKVRLENGEIVVSPLSAEDRPESAVLLENHITKRLPRVDLADLLIEVDRWTRFSDRFEHAGGAQPRSKTLLTHLYASLLGQACNFGLEQMAQITDIPYRRLAWCTTWYLREETLKSAITAIINYHHHLPLTQCWGGGTLSSSDGQRFPVSGKVRMARALPPYFGYGTGLTFYSWTSDQFSQYGTKVVCSTTRDAPYVLDEILNNETELRIIEHTTDTAGYTEIIFALFDLLGMQFSPRIRDIGDQQLYRMDSIDINDYKNLKNRIKKIIKQKFVLEQWDDLLRVAGSLKLGWVTASLLIQKLQSFPRKNVLAKALQEYGRILKTIHILRWYESEVFRRRINIQLNKGEALHSLRSEIHFANKGYIRKSHEEDLFNQASCLNLVVNAVITWNTVYMAAVIDQLKAEGVPVQESDLPHLWPTRHEHINVHGKVRFNIEEELKRKGLRPLRKLEADLP